MSVWSYFILGGVASSVVWMAVCWLLLNQRDAARFEATYLRVARPHPEVRRRIQCGDELPSTSSYNTHTYTHTYPPTRGGNGAA